MAVITDEITERVKKFSEMISASGLHLERAILFGFSVRGTANRWSDIDIAPVHRFVKMCT